MNKTVIIFAAYFPPRRRVGSIRPFRFATKLKELGWKPHVITIKDEKNTLTESEKEALKDIPVFEIQSPIDNTQPKKGNKTANSNSKGITSFIDNIFPIDTWLPLYWKKWNEIESYIKSVNPDLIWSTSDPWSTNYVAGKMAKKLHIPWVADFRDPWTLCAVRYDKRRWPATHIDRKIENFVLKNADHVTFTAESTLKNYESEYPHIKGKTSVVTNSFIEVGSNEEVSLDISLDEEDLNILFLGKFRELSNADLILQVLRHLKDLNSELLEKIRIYSLAELQGKDSDFARELDLIDTFKTVEPVPFEKVQQLISYFDLMLLSTHSERDDIIPAKLFDYLNSGKPVFSLAPNPEVGFIIEKTGIGTHFLPNEHKQAAEFLSTLVLTKISDGNLVNPGEKQLDRAEVNKFEISSTTAALVQIFNSILDNG